MTNASDTMNCLHMSTRAQLVKNRDILIQHIKHLKWVGEKEVTDELNELHKIEKILDEQDQDHGLLYTHLGACMSKMGEAYMTLDDARGVMETEGWRDEYFLRMAKFFSHSAREQVLEETISYLYEVVEREGDTRITSERVCDYEAHFT